MRKDGEETFQTTMRTDIGLITLFLHSRTNRGEEAFTRKRDALDTSGSAFFLFSEVSTEFHHDTDTRG